MDSPQKAAPRLTPAEMQEIGEALYGNRWQTDMARALKLKDARRVRDWYNSIYQCPLWMRGELVKIMRERAELLRATADKMDKK